MTAPLRNLLKEGINDEALRRMARRAGVQATSQKETDHVNNALRAIGEQILANMCEKLAIYTQHRGAKTVSQADFRATCDYLKIKLGAYAVPNEHNTFENCRKFSPGSIIATTATLVTAMVSILVRPATRPLTISDKRRLILFYACA